MPETEQGEILQNLIAECSGTNHEHAGFRDLRLIPPGNEAQAAESIFDQLTTCDRYFDLGSCSRGRNLRLQAENVAVPNRGIIQSLSVLDLSPGILVVKLVTQRSSIGAVRRKAQLLDQHRDDLVAWSIVR